MSNVFELFTPFETADFGGRLRMATRVGAHALVDAAERHPEILPQALAQSGGLLLIEEMDAMAEDPGLLVRLSRIFGPEVEDYRDNLTPLNQVHPEVPEIFIVSNAPGVGRAPPKRPDPPLTPDGRFPVQFPHRRGWHTDQSYRRPPPDISLFLAVEPAPRGQRQTLFADTAAAYEALPADIKRIIATREGLHVSSRFKRTRDAVLAGETPLPQAPHEMAQRQPLVRVHPVTGRKTLYLCEMGQMDWVDGPILGMQPGPDGNGAEMLFALMSHITEPQFVYVHEWSKGDLVVWDNRCLVHAATWFDAENTTRVMWRTTVSGNPGPLYAGEKPSWIAA